MLDGFVSLRTTTYAFLTAAAALVAPAALTLHGCGGGGGGGSGGGSTAAALLPATAPGPRVELTSPTSGAVAPGASVRVEGVVLDDGHGVERVVVGGQEVATGPGHFQATVSVVPGVNTIVVEAFDARGGRTERHVSVLAGRLSPGDVAIARGAEVALAGAAAPLASSFQTTTSTATGMPPVRTIDAYSGNYTRRNGRQIRYIVLHTIEGSEAGAISWFQNPSSRVSAHYIVSHAGRVTRMVSDSDRAWHAGNSTYNEQSIGIENEGHAGRNSWTDTQYRVLAQLVSALCDRYAIPKTRARIVAHSEVPGATHTDPGRYFDWNRFMALVNAGGTSTSPRPSTQTVTLPGGQQLAVAWTPRPVATQGGASRVELDVNVTPRAPVAGRLASSLVLGSPRAGAPATGGATNVTFGLHQDVINRALHAAWRAGGLDLRLSPTTLALLAPGSTATLDRDARVAVQPALGALLPPGSTLAVELAPALPPTARPTLGGELTLRLGALGVKLEVIDADGVTSPLGQVTCAVEVQAEVDGHGTTARLLPTSAGELRVDVAPGADPRLAALAHGLAPALRDASLGALAGVPLPTPPGVDLRALTLRASGDSITATGTQR